MKFNKLTLASLVVASGLLLSACGGDGNSAPPMVASANTTATINKDTGAATVGAVLDKTFTFPAGAPALGTSSNTTIKFAGTGTAPTFTIAAAEGTATGATTFGSCIFTVTASTFPPNHPLGLGKTLTVSPCALNIATAGAPADDSPASRIVNMVLGTTTSTGAPFTVTINPNGSVTINGANVGSVTLTPATGGGA